MKMQIKLMIALFIACMLAAACAPANPSGPVEVKVTLTEFKIESSLTEFQVGVPYHYVVTNEGAIAHEIMLMKTMDNSSGMDMEEMDKMALAHIEADNLPVGGIATFDYTFIVPAAPGELEFACHIPGHYEAGMKLAITVK